MTLLMFMGIQRKNNRELRSSPSHDIADIYDLSMLEIEEKVGTYQYISLALEIEARWRRHDKMRTRKYLRNEYLAVPGDSKVAQTAQDADMEIS